MHCQTVAMNICISLLFVFLLVVQSTATLPFSCRRSSSGALQLYIDGRKSPSPIFDCLRATKHRATVLHVHRDNTQAAQCTTSIQERKNTTITTYHRVSVETGLQCKYICRPALQEYECTSQTSANRCTCRKSHARLVTMPTNGTEMRSATDTTDCSDKSDGYQFSDPIACVSMRGQFHKQRVYRTKRDGICITESSTRSETRYMALDSASSQTCVHRCRLSAPRCTQRLSAHLCRCAAPKLTKQLVPVGDATSRLLTQTRCREGRCGACGKCDNKSGQCVLRDDVMLRKYCKCGYRCPSARAVHRRVNKAAALLCEVNVRLECANEHTWLRAARSAAEKLDGKRVPNLCHSGVNDLADTCGCAPGFRESPGMFSSSRCVADYDMLGK